MADYTSIQIIKKAPNVWVFSDNTLPSGKYWFSNAYQDIGNEDLVSFTTRNGQNIYNSQPYSIYSYTDELDSGNDFTPTSADDLHIKLTERGFFDNTGGGGGSTPTLQGLANSLFGSLFGRGGQVVLIDDSELGFTTAVIDGLFQNNVARTTTYYFTGSGEVTANDMTTKVNNLIQVGNPDPAGFTISEIQTPVIMIGVRAGVSYVYVFKKGKGTWGTLVNPVEASDFRLISFYNTTPEDIEDDPNATIIPLEDVVDNDFLAVANLTEWDFSDSGDATEDGGIITYYFTYTGEDSVEYFVRFIGDAGIYGGEETPFTSEMFTLTTSSVTSPDPTLLQVLTSGNTANLPIHLTTDDKTTKYSGEGLDYSEEENENTVTIRFESPTDTVELTIPAKAANDTFAMLSDRVLVFIDEGNGLGAVINGRIATNYGNVGLRAVDFSYNSGTSTTRGATGSGSFAAGSSNTASGTNSVVFGNGNTAGGNYSFVVGQFSDANGNFSAAFGSNSHATGISSFAAGTQAASLAPYSQAFGQVNDSRAFSSMTIGRFADPIVSTESAWVNGSPIFIVGNGVDASNKANAYVLFNDGTSLQSGKASYASDFGSFSGQEIPDWAAIQAAFILLSAIGVANGVASLDSNGKVPSTQLPSYVDDVLEFPTLGDFPVTGESDKIYIAIDTNLTYRWGGSSYVEISQSLALGETSSTAYRGDRGKTAYDHSQLTSGNPHNVTKSDVGLGNADNTSDADKPISTATQAALDDKVEIGGDLGGTISNPLVERITSIAEEAETVVATVLPDGEVDGQPIMELWVYDDTVTPYTLATLVAAYPTASGYLRGFEVRCRNLTPPTDYRKDSDGDTTWTKVERTVMT